MPSTLSPLVVIALAGSTPTDFSEHDWECNPGFRRASSACKAVHVPQNAEQTGRLTMGSS